MGHKTIIITFCAPYDLLGESGPCEAPFGFATSIRSHLILMLMCGILDATPRSEHTPFCPSHRPAGLLCILLSLFRYLFRFFPLRKGFCRAYGCFSDLSRMNGITLRRLGFLEVCRCACKAI